MAGVTNGMALKWVANVSMNGQWWMTAVVSTDHCGEDEARAKCRVIERALIDARLPLGTVRVSLTRWEGTGKPIEL
jgi:hypothetical protein